MGNPNELGSEDRRKTWQPAPRPEWLTMLNQLGDKMDGQAVIPLDEDSLFSAARHNTGLDDFGDDGWIEHFRVLIKAIEEEARLNFFGRILTRSELVSYLEARLQVTEAYRLNPEIEDEAIVEPVFILGLGRSGTSILHETLSHDPQFRSVRRWEALYPAPPPEAATYRTDPRIRKAQDRIDIIDAISPEWKGVHPTGPELPVEDIEFTYLAFFSEVWVNAFQIPTYERYFREQAADYHFHWHKRILKLLQFKYMQKHWLLKNPTHMERIEALLKAYPDAKIILPHRDPIVTADSVVNTSGTIYYWRTDNPFLYPDTASAWADIGSRVAMWDDVIAAIENGVLRKGYYANLLYYDFIADPQTVIEEIYRDLHLELKPEVLSSMLTWLKSRHQSGHGNSSKYQKSRQGDARTAVERESYRKYQEYFKVPDEI
ncbi:sulfotransferase [Sphingobium sp. EM0848]|uniref:sulfotransferase family protein n=1 Tax=Sphingobium sp. EM0848 TaxID=2743473 RepID=UPI00159C4B2A|nr:sulfotransferase [Sphingobium sp. EM0848]